MTTAIIADIHGNIEALESVLSDMDFYRPERIIVLGDIIGYGPNPKECLDRVFESTGEILIGNHEANILWPDPDMDIERDLLQWTEDHTKESKYWNLFEEKSKALTKNEMATLISEGMTYVHASAAEPVEQYIWPAHKVQYIIFNDQIDARLGEFLDEFKTQIGFCAHTHAPAVLTQYSNKKIFDPYENTADWNRESTFVGPNHIFFVPDGGMELKNIGDSKMVINPGSVGQPRDGNRYASYAIYEPGRIIINRVSYDYRKTQQKISEMPIKEETRNYMALRLQRAK